MKEFEDLSAADKLTVVRFIEDNIEKHFREHQIYATVAKAIVPVVNRQWLSLEEGDEKGEADIEDSWFECVHYDEKTGIYCGKSQMGEEDAINHAMWHLGFREVDVE